MHYRNGREAKNGDKVIQFDTATGEIIAAGVLYGAVPGNDYCNGGIAPTLGAKSYACMVDCLHADDLAALLAEKVLGKRPTEKPVAPAPPAPEVPAVPVAESSAVVVGEMSAEEAKAKYPEASAEIDAAAADATTVTEPPAEPSNASEK